MSYRDYIPRILEHNRRSMRDCALSYRKAKASGNFCFMVKWLILAAQFREINKGLLESA